VIVVDSTDSPALAVMQVDAGVFTQLADGEGVYRVFKVNVWRPAGALEIANLCPSALDPGEPADAASGQRTNRPRPREQSGKTNFAAAPSPNQHPLSIAPHTSGNGHHGLVLRQFLQRV